jgi:hypothetical protein
MKKIYLAHPISSMSTDEVFTYYDNMTNILKPIYEVLSPMLGKDSLRCEKEFRAEGYGDPMISNHALFERDTWMVKQCDIILCDFTDARVSSIGCAMELAIGSWLYKHTVIVMPKGNINDHAFIREAGDIIFDNIDSAIEYLNVIA